MKKLILKWLGLILPSGVMAIVGRVLAPFLPPFANDRGYLPQWLNWFQTPFNSLDGDHRHQERWPGADVWSTYLRRVAWLLRNVCYGFDMKVCGIPVDPDSDVIEVIGNPDISDKNGVSGLCRWFAYRDDEIVAWQLYYICHYEAFGLKKCIRLGLGWKLWDNDKLRSEPSQYFLYFHPFKTAFN